MICVYIWVQNFALYNHVYALTPEVDFDLTKWYVRGLYEKHLCEIILNFDQLFRRRCRLKYFLITALVAILFGGAEPFRQMWLSALRGPFLCNNFEFGPLVQEDMSSKEMSYLVLPRPSFSTEQWHLAISAECVMRNISLKLFWICISGSGYDVVKWSVTI